MVDVNGPEAMVLFIKRKIAKIYLAYADTYIAAPLYEEKVFGAHGLSAPGKSQIRKAMLLDVGAMLELGKLAKITASKLGITPSEEAEIKQAQEDNDNPLNEVGGEFGQ
tara:strand:+ start:205 stop:531 length:327 start_codon:yes stop_codon:yes gene_type:complete